MGAFKKIFFLSSTRNRHFAERGNISLVGSGELLLLQRFAPDGLNPEMTKIVVKNDKCRHSPLLLVSSAGIELKSSPLNAATCRSRLGPKVGWDWPASLVIIANLEQPYVRA